ncbi:MAG: CxxxxCH/CxxCH domain-containing protein [Polyangiaceae bacterium]
MSRRRVGSTILAFAALCALLGSGTGCLEARNDPQASVDTRCSACHGDSSRAGDALLRSAPPRDLSGASLASYPGVGAHLIHLQASATHSAIACTECHIVPKTIDAPGHADSARPAELVFGPLARTDHHSPSYDPIGRNCTDSYCHRDADAVWTEPRPSKEACGTCHGLPPPAPHPQSARCSACHAQVVDEDARIIAPALHVDGKVEFEFGKCSLCHGQGDNPAPPLDASGNSAVSARGVGAHAAHLAGGAFSRPLACNECHQLPREKSPEDHVDGLPAEVVLSGVASTGGRVATWDAKAVRCSDSWCHSPGSAAAQASPRWTDRTSLGCTSCHGAPPPPPHPQLQNCVQCHAGVVGKDNRSIADRRHHVDGVVDVEVPTGCIVCHGAVTPAPPVDVSGNTSTNAVGVGAHQTHVLGTLRSRPVPCEECHVVPKNVDDPGHLDSALPAELRFSGAALAFGAKPAFAQGACTNTSCHGAVFPSGDASGATNPAPVWTTVDGTQAKCGSCHSLPPPRPHPYQDQCSNCHQDIAADLSFTHPELHVDGVVTFAVP